FCFILLSHDLSTSDIDTLSLHDALPISSSHPRLLTSGHRHRLPERAHHRGAGAVVTGSEQRAAAAWMPVRHRRLQRVRQLGEERDRKSTRLNSSHLGISYAVFCLKKKKE